MTMDVPMFEPDGPVPDTPGVRAATPVDYVKCGNRGEFNAWKRRRWDRKPVCNRPAGHQGDHVTYDRKAAILATWSRS